jgi:hypothetical protein
VGWQHASPDAVRSAPRTYISSVAPNRPSGDRTLTWWPIVGAAIVAAIGVGSIIVFGSGSEDRLGLQTDNDGALTCPTSYVQEAVTDALHPRAWVPIQSVGLDGTKYLVPDTKPQHVTVCHYSAAGTTLATKASLPLLGSKSVTSGLSAFGKSLSKVPKAGPSSEPCTTPGDPYLIGVVIPTGAVWVSVPDDGCQVVTNGEYDTSVDLRGETIAAYQSGAWS